MSGSEKNAVGFYWTLPVPWAGFTSLDPDIAQAAQQSRTIRFQRELIHDYAKRNGYKLVHEEAFLEIEPDRGSEIVREPLDKAAAICRQQGAILLFVDFSGVQGWRSHHPMKQWLERAKVECMPVDAFPVTIDGEEFDPYAHFSDWRRRQEEWSSAKPERIAAAKLRAAELRADGHSYQSVADALNSESQRSPSGKSWTGEGVRKLLQS